MPHQAEMSTVALAYELRVEAGDVTPDPAQLAVVKALDEVLLQVSTSRVATKSNALGWLFALRQKQPQSDIKGLYIHGSVGRGKTMLMDMFFNLVPAKRKRRAHFNDFMADVHNRVHAQRQKFSRGESKESDPVIPVAKDLFDEAWVLCFDEFSVTDITDAMILSRLFEQLFKHGCILITTSNVEPDNLYKDGLNRSLFLPFITLLQDHVNVLNLDSPTDYRMEKLGRLPSYMTPLGADTKRAMDTAWVEISRGKVVLADEKIERKGRNITVPLSAGSAARFSFDDLCAQPLGAADYLAITTRYDVIFVDDVPQLGNHKRNEAKRFITLIDVLYDRKIRLFMSAACEASDLYLGERGTEAFEFARTASRLFEMHSEDYLD